ncbi:hypothetical protein PU629_16885 [Pullulanibacillus sp. KACC 23026]|uniref:hypothetical protein n=1 Tax=Pullulanibacillus sp. KACC 23026 TaxID=3028315 RepID=UPI0023B050CF|nr:hypothetical protein [Pullulanibacillus sp. KACC 23026]WEG11801.1 hypothetical protein PU629_16885 [Pullulanibacillus sp. KACC 23026]
MKPALFIQLALLLLAVAFIAHCFVAFSNTLLLIAVGISVVLGNVAILLKVKLAADRGHSGY